MPTRRPPRCRDEKGQAVLEIIGTIPIFLLVLGTVIQLFLVGYAAVAAESTARHAARAYSAGSSPAQARGGALDDAPRVFAPTVAVADGDLSESGDEPSVSGSGLPDSVSAKAVFTVPFLGFGVSGLDIRVTRYSVLPRTE